MELSSSPSVPAGYLLTKLAQLTAARFGEAIAALGLRPRHYGLLVAVAGGPPGSQQQLGQVMGVAASAVVGMLDDLEGLGAVVRRQDPNNRRQFTVELTEQGRALLAEATRLGAELDTQLLGALGEAERAAFQQTLYGLAVQLGLVVPVAPEALASPTTASAG